MAEIKPHESTSPTHPHKIAKDAYGGDPLNPNEAMLQRIAAVVIDGKKDDLVSRWATAFKTICPEPIQLLPTVSIEVYTKALPEIRPHLASPFLHRVTLGKVADAVDSGKKDDEASAWAAAVKALEG